jgi:hypothetical protein
MRPKTPSPGGDVAGLEPRSRCKHVPRISERDDFLKFIHSAKLGVTANFGKTQRLQWFFIRSITAKNDNALIYRSDEQQERKAC